MKDEPEGRWRIVTEERNGRTGVDRTKGEQRGVKGRERGCKSRTRMPRGLTAVAYPTPLFSLLSLCCLAQETRGGRHDEIVRACRAVAYFLRETRRCCMSGQRFSGVSWVDIAVGKQESRPGIHNHEHRGNRCAENFSSPITRDHDVGLFPTIP